MSEVSLADKNLRSKRKRHQGLDFQTPAENLLVGDRHNRPRDRESFLEIITVHLILILLKTL